MKKTFLVSSVIILGISLSALTTRDNTVSQTVKVDSSLSKKTEPMKNLIAIAEIPTTDFSRAVAFYEAILTINIEEVEMDGIKIGLFPNEGEGTFVQLIHGEGYKPSSDGTTIYLNAGKDLQTVAGKVEVNGGKILTPKTEMGPDMGFYAIFTDTEGNKVGLYSKN